jgi:GNAT superfamily N-acetyltransferase
MEDTERLGVTNEILFTIKEVTNSQSQYLSGMNRWLELIFPEYCPPRFDKLLLKHRHPNGRNQIQIFIGLINGLVGGLAQQFYQEWEGGILADIDLLGVLEPFRRSGLASALVQQCLRATPEIARLYQLPAIGVTTLIDPNYAPIVQLHKKQGGQIRTDYQYPSGDIIVWYPMQREYEDIPTLYLEQQLQQFGRLLES